MTRVRSSQAAQQAIKVPRNREAVENEIPIPLKTITQATRHAGHLGMSPNMTEGKTQLAIPIQSLWRP